MTNRQKRKKKEEEQKDDWVTRAMKQRTKWDKNNLRSKDVAHLLDCSPDDVIELARKGKLEAHKRGRFWYFTLDNVVKFKKKRDKEEEEYLKRMDRDRYGPASPRAVAN